MTPSVLEPLLIGFHGLFYPFPGAVEQVYFLIWAFNVGGVSLVPECFSEATGDLEAALFSPALGVRVDMRKLVIHPGSIAELA